MPEAREHERTRYFLGSNEVVVADDIITPDEQAVLVHWTEDRLRRSELLANPKDPKAYSTPYLAADGGLTPRTRHGPEPLDDGAPRPVWIPEIAPHFLEPLPEEFWQIRKRVIALLGLDELEEDPYKGSFLKYIMPGGEVHEHCDDRLRIGGDEFLLLRCNLLFKRPERGGMPVINGKELDITDRGLWAFYPTEMLHSATVVGGEGGRGMLSFGFVVRPDHLWQRRFCLAPPLLSRLEDPAGGWCPDTLIDRMRQSPGGDGLSEERIETLRVLFSQTRDFSVLDISEDLDNDPAEVWEVVRQLQVSRLVLNASSPGGSAKVLVL